MKNLFKMHPVTKQDFNREKWVLVACATIMTGLAGYMIEHIDRVTAMKQEYVIPLMLLIMAIITLRYCGKGLEKRK